MPYSKKNIILVFTFGIVITFLCVICFRSVIAKESQLGLKSSTCSDSIRKWCVAIDKCVSSKKYNKGMKLCQNVIEEAQRLYGSQSYELTIILDRTAGLYEQHHNSKENDKAIGIRERSIGIKMNLFGDKKEILLKKDYYHLANDYNFFVADYDKAIFYYKKVLKKPLSFLSIGMLFSTYRNLSRSYQGKKDYENAEIYAVKAVELSKIVFEKKDLQYISSKKTLDTIRRIKGGGKRGWGE